MGSISDDILSLSLRLNLVDSLTLGPREEEQQQQQSTSSSSRLAPTILVRSHKAESTFRQSIDKYKPIVQFVDEYKDNKAYLQPSIGTGLTSFTNDDLERNSSSSAAAAASLRPTASSLSSQSIISLLLESEADLRQLDRDLRLCEQHRQRDTAGAGRLAEHESLKSRLTALLAQARKDQEAEREIDGQVMQLVARYSTHVDVVSKLFLHWDQILTQSEDALARLERSRR